MKKLKKLKWKNKTERKNFLKKLISDDKIPAKEYEKNDAQSLGDFISHPKFGFGFVFNIISETKIEVSFEESEKVMLQNWALLA